MQQASPCKPERNIQLVSANLKPARNDMKPPHYLLIWESDHENLAWICVLDGDVIQDVDFVVARDMMPEEFVIANHDTDIYGYMCEMEDIDELQKA